MKYVIFLGDGMADLPLTELDQQTPLDVAAKPHMDLMATYGALYTVRNVPLGMSPGSDTANMSAMGFDPRQYYSGRSPLEAVSLGIKMADTDVSFRVNLVTLSKEDHLADCTMIDYSSGEITSEESACLIADLAKTLNTTERKLYAGKSYRHCLIWHGGPLDNQLTPPHDISGRNIGDHLPAGPGAKIMLDLMEQSRLILRDHPVNLDRRRRGLNEATCLWPWGEGTKPSLPNLYDSYGINGAVISAVDLVQGLGICSGMDIIKVPGATGTLSTNFKGKAEAAISALDHSVDYLYIHMEAPDECGHQGNLAEKIEAIERIDHKVIGPVWRSLEANRRQSGENYRLMVMPDHPTPIQVMTHTADPVPCAIYDSSAVDDHVASSVAEALASDGKVKDTDAHLIYCERNAEAAAQRDERYRNVEGYKLFARFINTDISLL
ncbi:MAG TPA: cofactor-independent phosphoglycerate mutase [Clostridiaceae bacterium]|nr:cofactor-independent phosphoglycerate mutase [Clostridiaceae bacterium]